MNVVGEKYSQRPDTILYHYTCAEGLVGILTSGTLWATSVNFLNDAKEVRYGVEVLSAEIQKRIAKCGKKARRFLEDTEKILAAPEMYLNAPIFVFSLSEEGDLLSQWRGYCPKGAGFSLGFDDASLSPMLGHPQIGIARCIYSEKEQSTTISALLDETIAAHLDEYEPQVDLNAVFQLLWQRFLDEFFRIAALIKHHAFEEEKEWRIVYHVKELKRASQVKNLGTKNLRIRHRTSGRLLVPYVALPLKSEVEKHVTLPEIIAGPTMYPDLARTALVSLKEAYWRHDSEWLVGDTDKPKLDVKEVRNSDIPLREL